MNNIKFRFYIFLNSHFLVQWHNIVGWEQERPISAWRVRTSHLGTTSTHRGEVRRSYAPSWDGTFLLPPDTVCIIWANSYFAFGSYARFKSRNIEFCNLIVYLIIKMFLYRGQPCSEIFLYLIYRSLCNLEQFLLCVSKLCEV